MSEPIKFKAIKIYSFYTEPTLYTAIDQFGQKYLVNLVDYDESKALDIWLAIPATDEELIAINSNKLSFHDFTTEHKSPNALVIKSQDKEITQKYIPNTDIPEEWLPEPNIFADFDNAKS